jgi:hypothetical protein
MAFWFVNRAPEKPPVDWRPTAWTLAFDLSAQTKDGLGQLLLGSSDGEQTVSAPVTWSFGASVGMMGQYTARELFGDAPFQPSESIIASMDRALSTCDDVCAINKDAKGCDKFRKFTTGARDDRLDRWFVTNVALTPQASCEHHRRAQRAAPGWRYRMQDGAGQSRRTSERLRRGRRSHGGEHAAGARKGLLRGSCDLQRGM